MSEVVSRLREDYRAAFGAYLVAPSEAALQTAYELGRRAVGAELSVLDVATIHHDVLAAALKQSPNGSEVDVAAAAADFLLESLSAFEMLQRGYREARETVLEQKRHAARMRRLADHERRVAETLQRGLLPRRFPDVPGLSVAVRYMPGAAGVSVGGDWFDVVPIEDKRTGMAIGDVLGRGVKAASVMGQVRIAFRAYALSGDPPDEVLKRLDHLIQALELAHFSTMTYLILDSSTGVVTFTRAGHPPPLLVSPDGEGRYVEQGLSVPLGVMPDAVFERASFSLEPGSILVLYTDGLVEGDEGIDDGLERLRESVDSRAELETICDRVLKRMLRNGSSDDVALMLLRLDGGPTRAGA
jgi:serine phosphatase RsbU (regulator of sigma subunit)